MFFRIKILYPGFKVFGLTHYDSKIWEPLKTHWLTYTSTKCMQFELWKEFEIQTSLSWINPFQICWADYKYVTWWQRNSPQASEQVTFSWDVDWGLDSREQIFPRENHSARETTEDHTSWSMCEEDESGITLPWPDSDVSDSDRTLILRICLKSARNCCWQVQLRHLGCCLIWWDLYKLSNLFLISTTLSCNSMTTVDNMLSFSIFWVDAARRKTGRGFSTSWQRAIESSCLSRGPARVTSCDIAINATCRQLLWLNGQNHRRITNQRARAIKTTNTSRARGKDFPGSLPCYALTLSPATA